MVVVVSLDGVPSYALEDPRLPIPTIRRLIREGASVNAMRVENPTVTWPSHTSMVTGVNASRHQVLYNGLLIPPSDGKPGRIEPWRDKDEMVRATTVYDIAHGAGLTTAQVEWVAIYGARTITWKFPEIPDPDGEIEKELTARGVVDRQQLAEFGKGSNAWRDIIKTEAALHILTTRKPNLMLFHLGNTDSVNHQYGPLSRASYTAYALADARVTQLCEGLKQAGLLDRITLLIVSDHGFRAVNHLIQADSILKSKGIGGAWVVPEGGTAMVYATGAADRVAEALRDAEGVQTILGRDAYAELELPASGANSPDLVLVAKPGYAFSGGRAPVAAPFSGGSHGFLSTDPQMNAILVAWGAGVRRGARLERGTLMDVGPTIAELLGVKMSNVQGRVLRELLQ